MDPDIGPVGPEAAAIPVATRLVRWAAVVVLLAVAIAAFGFAVTWQGTFGLAGTETDRLILTVIMAVLAAGGWAVGTSALFVLFCPPKRLPRGAHAIAAGYVRGYRSLQVLAEAEWRDHPAVNPGPTSISTGRLLGVAFLEIPLLVWLVPLLLGWLVRGDAYQPVQAACVAAMGVVAVSWAVILVLRARPERARTGG